MIRVELIGNIVMVDYWNLLQDYVVATPHRCRLGGKWVIHNISSPAFLLVSETIIFS